jgi:hypothetical protein
MALFVFRSKAAGSFVMVPDTARQLLEILGKPVAERGVIPADQIDDALARLQRAVDEAGPADAGAAAATGAARAAHEDPAAPAPVGLRQRAYPLIQMLRAARARDVDVTWGI